MNRTLMFLVLMYCCATAFAAEVVSASLDLRKFGYRQSRSTSNFADSADLSFLSDDLLVILIGRLDFKDMVPDSTVIVFDVGHATATISGKMVSRTVRNSVHAISGGRFAELNQNGLEFCDSSLRCERIAPTLGPMFVSPRGRFVAVGGNQLTAQTVIDTESFKQVGVFGHLQGLNPVAIPGDGAMLIDQGDRIMVQRPGVEDVSLNIDSLGFREFRFLDPGSVACLDHGASEAVVFGIDGKQIRRYKVAQSGRTGFLPSAAGKRFGIYEHGYTQLNSMFNFLDLDEGRPENFQRVRVIDMSSGDEISRFEWDPRSRSIEPAISPNGHRIARVRGGILEVLEVK